MTAELHSSSTPRWIKEILKSPDKATFNLHNILENSVYYPASGLDGTPIKYLTGIVHSYVYADYGITRNVLLMNLYESAIGSVFKHYHKIVEKELSYDELIPSDLNLKSGKSGSSCGIKRLPETLGYWTIWQRNSDVLKDLVPEAFSLLFLIGEMSNVYHGLYNRLSMLPKILTIIQPGSFGGEWERVTSNDSFFRETVGKNSAGLPAYLLYGGFGQSSFYEDVCWTEYIGERLVLLPERHAGIWVLN